MGEEFWIILIFVLVGLTALVATMADMNDLDGEEDISCDDNDL